MSRNVRRHSHHRAPRCRWLLPFSKVAPSDRGAVLAVPPGAARALGGSPGGGRGRVRPRCALEGVPAGRARNKGWVMAPPTKKPALGNGLISCLQARRGGRWARFLQPAAHRSFLPLYQPPSPAIPTTCGHRAAPMQQPLSPSRCRLRSPGVASARTPAAILNKRLLKFVTCSDQLLQAHTAQLEAKGDRQQSS